MIELFQNNCISEQNSKIFTKVQKHSDANKVKFKIPGIQSKITRHANNWNNTTHNEETNQTIEHNLNLTQILELADKGINIITIMVFILFKKLKRVMKDIFNIPDQTSNERKNILDGINNKNTFNITEGKISKLEDKAIESIQN